MKVSTLNKQIIHFLQSIADEDTFYVRQNRNHPVCVGTYGGQHRIFTISTSPNSNYCNYMKPKVNRFIRTLPINTHTFNFQ